MTTSFVITAYIFSICHVLPTTAHHPPHRKWQKSVPCCYGCNTLWNAQLWKLVAPWPHEWQPSSLILTSCQRALKQVPPCCWSNVILSAHDFKFTPSKCTIKRRSALFSSVELACCYADLLTFIFSHRVWCRGPSIPLKSCRKMQSVWLIQVRRGSVHSSYTILCSRKLHPSPRVM